MKLYLSSIDVPTPNDLADLLGKPLSKISVALIPNAKDYYVERPRSFVINERIALFKSLGMEVTAVDLRDYSDAATLKEVLAPFDLIWAMGGNTFMLRYEMQRSGFEDIIQDLLSKGAVYGGDSAGALVAGSSLGGINLEAADEPEFAEKVIEDGLNLVPYVIVPHTDNPEFSAVMETVEARSDQDKIIKLKDSQAVIFNGGVQKLVEGSSD